MCCRSCDHWVQFPAVRSRCDWSSSQVSMPRTRPIPTTQKYHGCLEATRQVYILQGRSEARDAFCSFLFGFSSIRDTVLLSPPRSFKQQLLLPDKRTHDHYQHQRVTPTVPTNQTNQLLTAFLRTEQSILDFPRQHLSHPATRRSLLFAREPSLRRQTFHLDRRDSSTSIQQNLLLVDSLSRLLCCQQIINNTSIPSTVISHQICFPESTQPGPGILEFPTNKSNLHFNQKPNLAAKF